MSIQPQMPKYGNLDPDPSKIENLKKICFHQERLNNIVPTSPQPLLGDDFQRRYDFFPIVHLVVEGPDFLVKIYPHIFLF